MKTFYKYLIALFMICSCSTVKKAESDLSGLSNLYKEQKRYNVTVANSAKWARDKALVESAIKKLEGCDTLFLIERIDEVDKKVKAMVWSCKRDSVLTYNNQNGLEDSWVAYKAFTHPLKATTETFDIELIKSKKSYLDADYVFISQIANSNIKTFFFNDVAF